MEAFKKFSSLCLVLSFGMTCLRCGGGSKPTGTPADGKIYLDNKTNYSLEVSYPGELGEVMTTVAPGEMKEVSEEVLKAGTSVIVKVVYHFVTQPVIANIKVTISGNLVIRVTAIKLATEGQAQGGTIEYTLGTL